MCAKVSNVDAGSYLPTPATQPSPMHILQSLSLFIWSNAYSCQCPLDRSSTELSAFRDKWGRCWSSWCLVCQEIL